MDQKPQYARLVGSGITSTYHFHLQTGHPIVVQFVLKQRHFFKKHDWVWTRETGEWDTWVLFGVFGLNEQLCCARG